MLRMWSCTVDDVMCSSDPISLRCLPSSSNPKTWTSRGEIRNFAAALESEFQSLANALATNGQLPTTLAELRRVALEVADITNAEILDWRFVFRFRPLTLPR